MIRIHPKVSGLLADGDVPGLREALQSAIELEHAVIPPYLYALYSLAPGRNRAVAQILRSVIVEEMLHLTLAGNLLNAVGGKPALDSPGMLPRYPCPLPGTVDDSLIVGLAPFSIPLVRDVFMSIEEPERPGTQADGEPLTIGQFYRRIRAIVTTLGDATFTGPASRQVTTDLLPGAIEVTGVTSACQAIDTIIDQGEGTQSSPLEVTGTDVAHYYRFAEIVHGRKLIRFPGPHRTPGNEEDRRAYLGEPVTVNPAGIRDVPVNPTLDRYLPRSPARYACLSFNHTYTNLLRALNAAFNGDPHHLMSVLDMMSSLKQQAQDMMAGATTDGVPAGPSFEWQPELADPASDQISARAYIDGDWHAVRHVLDRVDELVQALGYGDPFDEEIERGSIFRKYIASIRRGFSSPEVQKRTRQAERALELLTVDSMQAQVDSQAAAALQNLINSLSEVPVACVCVGSIFLVKYTGMSGAVVLGRTLSHLEIRVLERFPEIQRNPETAFEALALALTQEESRSPSN